MGMYTEFIFGCELSKKTPKVCVDALDYVINGEEKQPKYENPEGWEQKRFNDNYIERTTPVEEIEKFIEEYDFYRLFCSCSYYFGAANPVRRFEWDNISNSYKISTMADLKNYSGQIEKFIEYIAPYVEHGSGYEHRIFAYVQYEEAHFPTMYGFDYDTGELKVFTNPTFNNEDPTLKYKERIKNLYDTLAKLYQHVCPEWKVDEEEYKKHNRPLPSEQEDPKPLPYDEIWDWMIDHIIDEYKFRKKDKKK
jgi:hypothetical protein